MLTCLRRLKTNPANFAFFVNSNSLVPKLAFVSLFSFFTSWVQAQETITVNSVTPNKICFSSSIAAPVDVNYSITGTFTGNTFTAQLSDATGSFTSPTDIGSLTSDASGTINATIAANTAAGTGYLIRVVSSSPADVVSNSVAFTINALPTVFNVTGGGGYCSGGGGSDIGLSGSELGVRYQLRLNGTPIGSMVPGTGSALDFGPHLAAGTFTVVATRTLTGCTNNMNGSAVIIVNPLPTKFTVTGGGATTCVAGVVLGLSGSQIGVNYQLLKDGGTIGKPMAGTGAALSFGNRHQSGTYTVLAINAHTGCTNTMTGSPVVTTPDLTITQVNPDNCGNVAAGSIRIDIASGGPYQFSINGGAFQGNGNTFTFSSLTPGDYSIQVQDINDPTCTATLNTLTIRVLQSVQASLFLKTAASCNGNDAQIVIAARNGPLPYTYSLDGGTPQGSHTFTGVAAGTHSVVVTDARGCTSTVSNITISQSLPPTASVYRVTGSSCDNGAIIISATGGKKPYTFSLNSGTPQSSNIFRGLTAGTYSVTVTDAKNCATTLSNITVAQLPSLTATVFRKTAAECNNGSIIIGTTGGTPPYTFSLNGGTPQSSNTFTGLSAGTYSVLVTDLRGCTATVSNIEIVLTSPPVAELFRKTAVTCMGGSDGTIKATASGGVPPYRYRLTGTVVRDFQISNFFDNLPAGTYNIFVRDLRGCRNTNDVTVVINDGTVPCITSGSASSSSVYKLPISRSTLKVQALPNPSRTEFTLNLQSSNKDRVQIIVTDMFGKKLYQTTGSADQRYTFGKELKSGMYIVQIIQGKEIQTLKLIKGN